MSDHHQPDVHTHTPDSDEDLHTHSEVSDLHDNDQENEPHSSDDAFYTFSLDAAGQALAVSQLAQGVARPSLPDSDETYATQPDGTVVKTEYSHGGTETTVYADPDGDGLFKRVSEQWTPSASSPVAQDAAGAPLVMSTRLHYQHTDADDLIAVRSGYRSSGGLGADDFVVREAAHLHIDDFDDAQGDKLVFDTGLGLQNVEDLQHYITLIESVGSDLVVHFGPDVSITLTGMAQSTTLGWDDVSVLS